MLKEILYHVLLMDVEETVKLCHKGMPITMKNRETFMVT
jgi:hypothetical protein